MQDDVTEYKNIDFKPDTIKELTEDFFINNNNKPLYDYITYVQTVLNNNIQIIDKNMPYKTSNPKNYKNICIGLKQNLYCIILNTIIDLYKQRDDIDPIEFTNKIGSITKLINSASLKSIDYHCSDFNPIFKAINNNHTSYYRNSVNIKTFQIEFKYHTNILFGFICNIDKTNNKATLYKNGFLEDPECAEKINNFYGKNKIPKCNARYYSDLYSIERNYNNMKYAHTLTSEN